MKLVADEQFTEDMDYGFLDICKEIIEDKGIDHFERLVASIIRPARKKAFKKMDMHLKPLHNWSYDGIANKIANRGYNEGWGDHQVVLTKKSSMSKIISEPYALTKDAIINLINTTSEFGVDFIIDNYYSTWFPLHTTTILIDLKPKKDQERYLIQRGSSKRLMDL